MTVQRQPRERHPWRRSDDRPWTAGEQGRFADSIGNQLSELDRKVDRLAWIVAIGSGVVATAAFAIGLVATFIPH